jgi:hypothetical protein
VLDLEARVHLEEEELAVIGQEHLDRARIDVSGGRRHRQGGFAHPRAKLGRHRWRRRLLDDLLVAALRRAVSLPKVDALPGRVEEHLHLDVAHAFEIPLEDQPVVAEGPMRLAACGRHGLEQRARLADHAHALAAAPGTGLDEQRIADALGLGGQRRAVLLRTVIAGDGRDTVGRRAPAGLGLVAHRGDRLGRRPDPSEAGGRHVAREVRILCEEPVAGMDRVGARAACDREDRLAVEVARDLVVLVHALRRAVARRMDADDPHPQPMRGPRDPHSDLTPIRDEQGPDRSA